MKPSSDIARLIEIMAALRTPKTGCPWDLEQNFATIAPYTIEEAYEVADAITRGDLDDLRDELGDLLLQVVFHARMAQEQRAFDFGDVVRPSPKSSSGAIRMSSATRRDLTPDQVKGLWSKIKAEEKAERDARHRQAGKELPSGTLSSVPAGLPTLGRALKLQAKAGTVGFDWNDPKAVLDKIAEEAEEISSAIESGSQDAAAEEIGDLLFAVVNLARHLKVDPETALRATNAKFERRFASIERALAKQGKKPAASEPGGDGCALERSQGRREARR